MPALSAADVSAGLPAPAVASALLGKAGAAALLVLLFLAVTSAASAELIAVSSVLTYDVYIVGFPTYLILYAEVGRLMGVVSGSRYCSGISIHMPQKRRL